MRVAPGIHRLGPGLVNSYLVEDRDAVTIVDAGAPGYWNALPAELAAMGRGLEDVRAVVLTHAHTDHIGFAERIRKERGIPIHVHRDDVPLTRKPSFPGFKGTVNVGAALRFVAFALRNGMARIPPILEVSTFADGEVIDVPGQPRVIHVPGHSEGMSALHIASQNVVFLGDAFVTLDVISGATGPRMSPFNADRHRAYESLSRLDGIQARLVLPGHGEPWADGLAEALTQVRAFGPPE